jgi:hypothetical protein
MIFPIRAPLNERDIFWFPDAINAEEWTAEVFPIAAPSKMSCKWWLSLAMVVM